MDLSRLERALGGTPDGKCVQPTHAIDALREMSVLGLLDCLLELGIETCRCRCGRQLSSSADAGNKLATGYKDD